MVVCMNCHILLQPLREQHEYLVVDLSAELLAVAEQWCGREATQDDHLCQGCFTLIVNEASNRSELLSENSSRQVGHLFVCICCGISLGRRSGRRRHRVVPGSLERQFIENEIFPRQVLDEAWACHRCWMRAYESQRRHAVIMSNESVRAPSSFISSAAESSASSSSVNDGQNIDVINLPFYTRVPDTSSHCFVPGCNNSERLRIPQYLKRAILVQYKIFIGQNARICANHISRFNWDILNDYEFSSTFTSQQQIVSMLNLVTNVSARPVLNFENVQDFEDNLCRYWTGLGTINFMALYNSVPPLQNVAKKAKTALGIYLIKIRTGESINRIASLFLMATGTVCTYLKKVRMCLEQNYVTAHLGIGHITRAEHSSRNLSIPQGLFGTSDNNPIIICDGTYVYLQKSSNFLFQKKTYSLHKYQNLVKPFLMVTCDGHILDVSGPYGATESDADILKKLFNNTESPMRSYFRENDIFILDRGFRDSIGLLESLGYSVYKPEDLSPRETQLSTVKANKSRFVTLCRWVVEVVNGRFKQDFKIFRSKYFNLESRNLMTDFKIAAALINNFHPVITDHPDAQSILNRALERFEMPNNLADYVIEHRLNRHSATFVSINAQLPQLNVFPVMDMNDLVLFGLGTYQIKLAKSYYREHIRQNGTIVIEVDTNLQQYSSNSVLLRGRIKSRHISNKIYFTYILLNLNAVDWDQRLNRYYCSCIIGKRTIGSCAHVMAVVWYLGWARHQDTAILPPASFLDEIIIDEIENEE